TSAPILSKNPPSATKSFWTSTTSSAAWAGKTFCSNVDNSSWESANTSASRQRSFGFRSCSVPLAAERIHQRSARTRLCRVAQLRAAVFFLVSGAQLRGGFYPPPYCLSPATVSFQSLSDIHPSGLPAVFGVTHVSNDSSASRRDMAGIVASENFLTTAAISSTCARP